MRSTWLYYTQGYAVIILILDQEVLKKFTVTSKSKNWIAMAIGLLHQTEAAGDDPVPRVRDLQVFLRSLVIRCCDTSAQVEPRALATLAREREWKKQCLNFWWEKKEGGIVLELFFALWHLLASNVTQLHWDSAHCWTHILLWWRCSVWEACVLFWSTLFFKKDDWNIFHWKGI